MRTVTPVKKTYLDAAAVDGGRIDAPPRVIEEVRPTAPAALGGQGSPPTAVIRFVIDRRGRIGQPRIVRADDDRLIPPALEAISRWRVTPALRDGEPIPSHATVQLTFDSARQ